MSTITLFVIIQLINVVLSTIKSILTVSGSRWTAAIINAISYTFGAVVTKLITEQNVSIVITVTLFTNIIGVYFAKWILDKTKKERLWSIVSTIKSDDKDKIETELLRRGIQFTLVPAANERYHVTLFSYSKGESLLIKEVLESVKAKYYITENIATL